MKSEECNEPAQSITARLLAAAEGGDVEAMFDLGEAFRTGDEIARDHAQALIWLRRAAENGHSAAQNNLGSMFLNGMGTSVDAVEASLWYQLAARQGQPEAQFNLALRYLHGNGVPMNLETAVEWLRAAATQGHVEAIGQLGTLYRFGQGVDRDFVSAAELHVTAAMAGDVTSMGNLVGYQDEIENAALSGSVLAAICLAKMHDRGLTVPRDKSQTWAWLQWASSRGTRDNDADVLEELNEWMNFEELFLEADVRQQAERLLVRMAQRANDARHG